MGETADQLLAATRAMLDHWVRRGDGTIERCLTHFTPDTIGVGSGEGEVAIGLEELRSLMEREHSNIPRTYTYRLSGEQVRCLGDTGGVVHGEVSIEVPLESSEVVTVAFRLVCALQQVDDRWLVAYFGISRPDPEQAEDESFPLDALRARNEELERLVAERTADLRAAQAQLVHQEKMASLGALTAGIAHEIKNPLNFVTGFAALGVELADELGGAEGADRAEIVADLRANAARIAEHGARADAIVSAMMQHAQGGAGERQAVDLNGLVAEYAGHARHALLARDPDADVALDLRLGGDVGTVEAVPQEIGRAVVALLSNAFDAVRQRLGAGRVTVSTARAASGVEIRVEDDGPGLAPDVAARVFEPFYTTKPTGQGHTGLGLSLAHDAVVQGHGGTLTAQSEPGNGAAFTLSLPAH